MILANKSLSCTLSKWALMEAMFHKNSKHGFPININGRECLLSSIEREDGSGKCFNLTVFCDGQKLRFFCRTND